MHQKKLDKETNKCYDNCTNDKYEFNNICYDKCQHGEFYDEKNSVEKCKCEDEKYSSCFNFGSVKFYVFPAIIRFNQ